MRIAALALILAVGAIAPAGAQTIEQRLERWFGPPASQGSQARRPSRANVQAQARPPSAASVPTPTLRPGEDAPTPDDAPAAADSEPAQNETPVPAPSTGEPVVETPQTSLPAAETEAPSSSQTPAIEAVPLPEGRPEQEPGEKAEPEVTEQPAPAEKPEETPAAAPGEAEPGPADDAGEAAVGEAPDSSEPAASREEQAEPDEAPEPAYVPPESARTTPEDSAPETPEAAVSPAMSVEAARAVEDAEACEAELKARGATFTVGPSLSDGECGVLRPVALTRTSSGITVSPATQMLCRTALAFDIWVGESVIDAAKAELDEGAPTSIAHASTYVCRERASEAGISEHARGSAIDIAAFEWEGGRETIAVEEQAPNSEEDRFLASVRRAACGPFATVIGPGTDADHADHFHLDIAARNNGSRYCR